MTKVYKRRKLRNSVPTPPGSIREALLALGLTHSTPEWKKAYRAEYRKRNVEMIREIGKKYDVRIRAERKAARLLQKRRIPGKGLEQEEYACALKI